MAGAWQTIGLGDESHSHQLWLQLAGVVVNVVWCGGVNYVVLKIVDAVSGLRVSTDDEREGLDFSQHGEAIDP